MGCWGCGIYDNDDALDLLLDFKQRGVDALLDCLRSWESFLQRKSSGEAPRIISKEEWERDIVEARRSYLENNSHISKEVLERQAADLFNTDYDAGILIDTGAEEIFRLGAAAGIVFAARGGGVRVPGWRVRKFNIGDNEMTDVAKQLESALSVVINAPELVPDIDVMYMSELNKLRIGITSTLSIL